MKAEKFREFTIEELTSQLDEMQSELFNLKMNKAVSQLDNPLRIRLLRRDIARIKTIINENRLGIDNK